MYTPGPARQEEAREALGIDLDVHGGALEADRYRETCGRSIVQGLQATVEKATNDSALIHSEATP